VLITIDTLRPDRLGCYGHRTNRTPSIDRIAREGTMFDEAYCDMPWTTGSMSSVMTGQYSSRHGVQLPMHKLKPEAVTLAELLQARGYQTGAIIGSFPLDSVYGLDQGFETYDDEFDRPMFAVAGQPLERIESQLPDDPREMAAFVAKKLRNDAFRSDESVTDAAVGWLDKVRDGRPFFLWVHYFGPHEKYHDENLVDQEPGIIAAYDADVEAADRAVGRFVEHLRELRLLDGTLLILHADHGQSLGERGYVGHGLSIDDESVRIPLLLRYPRRVGAGIRRRDIGRNIDLLPTILEAVDRKQAEGFPGRSLLPTSSDPEGASVPPERQAAYFESYLTTILFRPIEEPEIGVILGPVSLTGIRTPKWRLTTSNVVGPCSRGDPSRDAFGTWILRDPKEVDEARCRQIRKVQLFGGTDHGSSREMSAEHPDVVAELEAILRLHVAQPSDAGGRFTLSPEQERKLRSLGYLR
jgi:arylsulfatase A-like enzyme